MKNPRETWWVPILAGAVVGLVTGTIGMALAPPDVFAFAGGMLGAVCGGSAAAAVSNQGTTEDVVYAGVADVASSVLFFVIVVVALLVEPNEPLGALLFAPYLLLFGTVVAVPIAAVSLFVALLSGLVTSLAKTAVSGRRG